ncbi:MAG: DNA polymerase III subunit chi [Gammaproteobacteria bacterium]
MSLRVDFYISAMDSIEKCYPQVCRLTEKIYQQQRKAYIHTENLRQAQHLDELLWTFCDTSFIPHHFIDANNKLNAPIQIGYQQMPDDMQDVLINLTLETLEFDQKFQRIIKFLPANTQWKTTLREHYRLYRDQGCELFNHKIP